MCIRDSDKVVDAQNEIVEVGTGVMDKNVTEKDNEIPYQTITRENKDIPQGTRRVKQKGIKGIEHVVTTQPTLNGKPYGEPTVEKTITKEKQDEIIEIGTGIKDMTKDISERKIPFDTVTKINNDLPEGERRVKQEGQDLSLIHISEPTRRLRGSRMPSSA